MSVGRLYGMMIDIRCGWATLQFTVVAKVRATIGLDRMNRFLELNAATEEEQAAARAAAFMSHIWCGGFVAAPTNSKPRVS